LRSGDQVWFVHHPGKNASVMNARIPELQRQSVTLADAVGQSVHLGFGDTIDVFRSDTEARHALDVFARTQTPKRGQALPA